jgi:hypothetical protein
MRFIKFTTVFAGAALLLASCIKERGVNFTNQGSPSPNIVTFPNQQEIVSLDISPTPTIYTFYADLNSSNGSYPATTVTIAKNPTLVAANGFDFLPDSAYSLVSTTSTVDPVTHLAPFQLRINTTKIDLSKTFAVGYTITSTSGGSIVASNKNTTLIPIGAKNRYDGVYQLKMKLTGWAAYGIDDGATGIYPLDIYVKTAGANTVTIQAPDGPFDNLQPGFTGGVNSITGYTAFGATTPKYTFDLNTNALTNVVNTTPDDGRGRTLFQNATITTSRFDPATKKMYLAYVMTQNGRPNQFIYDTMSYLHARP